MAIYRRNLSSSELVGYYRAHRGHGSVCTSGMHGSGGAMPLIHGTFGDVQGSSCSVMVKINPTLYPKVSSDSQRYARLDSYVLFSREIDPLANQRLFTHTGVAVPTGNVRVGCHGVTWRMGKAEGVCMPSK